MCNLVAAAIVPFGLCCNLYLNERGSSGSYDLHNDCLHQLSRCALNNLREIVTERPMKSARAFHIFTVWMKKDLWYEVVLHFLGTKRVTFVMLLDLVALERKRLVGITVGSTLTSSVTKPYLDRYSCQYHRGRRSRLISLSL